MSFLHLGDAAIRKYSATTTGTKSVIKIEIETSDTYRLHAILRDLAEAQKELSDARKPKKAKPETALQIEHREMLALPYLGDD